MTATALPPACETTTTVVVTDSGSPRDALRTVSRALATAPEGAEVVLASVRSLPLPAPLARRVRRLRASDPAELDRAAASLAGEGGALLVVASTAALGPDWPAAVAARCASAPHVVSVAYGRAGGLVVFPPTVGSDGPRAVWDATGVAALRGAELAGPRRTLSAVLIVKDEEDVLDACLEAVLPFVDEVVVYDTGSTDGTVELARRHGAVVVEGFWDDHFGDARNRALAHATGDWVLHVDADEVVSGDVDQLRTLLDVERRDQLHVRIVSTAFTGSTTGSQTSPIRLFRREGYAWTGALHEYPAPVDPARPATASPTPAPIQLTHSGYHVERMAARGKAERNLALAERELAAASADDPGRAELLSNYGRSLLGAGRVDDALAAFDELRRTSGHVSAIVSGGRSAVAALTERGDLPAVLDWLEVLQACRESAGNVAVLRARALLASGDLDAAQAAVADVREPGRGGRDLWGTPFEVGQVSSLLAEVALARGDLAGAVEHTLVMAASAPQLVDLPGLLAVCRETGRPVVDVVRAAPADLLTRSLSEAGTYEPALALAWLEAFAAEHPGDVRPLLVAGAIAPSAGWRTCLAWSLRAREAGLVGDNALRLLATAEGAPALERAACWLLLDGAFAAADAAGHLSRTIPALTDAECRQLQALAAHLGATLVIDRAA